MLISKHIADRAGIKQNTSLKPDAFFKLAKTLKKHAVNNAGLAIDPSLKAVKLSLSKENEFSWLIFGKFAPIFLAIDLFLLSVIIAGLFTPSVFAFIALTLFHFQPFIATYGTKLKTPDILSSVLLRLPITLIASFSGIISSINARMTANCNDLRETYDKLLADGLDKFFITRRNTCPICRGKNLKFLVETPDLISHKPGSFVMEQCRNCKYIFQNPRLSIKGLHFYYKDFYDGIGTELIELLLGSSDIPYLNRAKLFKKYCDPEKWLDVGGGSGYFCCVARDIFPDTQFDGLDLSNGMISAQKQGWVKDMYQGQFPEVSKTLTASYDTVSLIQYLEHTIEPEKELMAAHNTLKKDGILIIEVPNPDFPLFKILGKYWFQWLQPQHLYFFSTENMEKLLKKCGFEPVGWDLTSAHAPIDFVCAAVLFVRSLVPSPIYPWLPKKPYSYFILRAAILAICSPLIAAGILIDVLLFPFFRLFKISNNYTVIAKRLN